ncbi:MAG TPA: twin-arginine translocase TatA/TatE family subunit [Candidatus Yaniella excrementavium]|nr:twin-arginine translocase TatA/TatE family subunit [Candidatus Yaniella excrementavium]
MNIFRNPVILLVLVLLAFLLFGANKLPKMARNMGQSMRILKSEVKEMKSDSKGSENTKTTEESGNEKEESAVEGTVIPDSENAANPGSEEQRSK